MNNKKHPLCRSNTDFTISSLIQLINKGEGFAMAKLCHGFWELCVRLEKNINFDSSSQAQIEKAIADVNANWPLSILSKIKKILSQDRKNDNLFILASEYGWQEGLHIEGTPIIGLQETQELMRRYIHFDTRVYDGLFWKNSIQDQSFVQFISFLKNKPVIIIGPDFIKEFSTFCSLNNSYYVNTHDRKAAWHFDEIMAIASEAINNFDEEGVICLIEAGGVTSSCLAYDLHKKFPNHFFFALGQVLNLCNIGKIETTNWAAVYRTEICQCIEAINPQWNIDRNDFNINSPYKNIANDLRWESFRFSYDPNIYNQVSNIKKLEKHHHKTTEKINFIENKLVDFELLQDLLNLCESKNQWANFGPLQTLLEKAVHNLLDLPPTKSVIFCKSGTSALSTLINVHEYKQQKKMRWVISAFGFFSSNLGPLSDAIIIDCDAQGILDFEKLSQLDPFSWDGIVLTNTFGTMKSIKNFEDFCVKHEKTLIIDNATALLSPIRQTDSIAHEIISFHQTKPWGMGEGGCAITYKEDATIFRNFINFGSANFQSVKSFVSNEKIAEVNCALITQRLLQLPKWSKLYKLQERRINKIAQTCGLQPLSNIPDCSVVGHLPFISEHTIKKEKLENNFITLRKYYAPLDSNSPKAGNIFSHIVNIPCHSGIKNISDQELTNVIKKLGKE